MMILNQSKKRKCKLNKETLWLDIVWKGKIVQINGQLKIRRKCEKRKKAKKSYAKAAPYTIKIVSIFKDFS